MVTLHKDGTVSYFAEDGGITRSTTVPDYVFKSMDKEEQEQVIHHLKVGPSGPGRPLAAGEGRRLWSCRLPLSTIERIKAIAEREGISQAQVVMDAVKNMS